MWCGVIFTRRADGRDISGLIADLSETDASTRLSIIHVKVLGIGLISLLLIFVLFDRSLFRCDHESFKLFWLRHGVAQQPVDTDYNAPARGEGEGMQQAAGAHMVGPGALADLAGLHVGDGWPGFSGFQSSVSN